MTIVTVAAGDLIEHGAYYPRHHVDSSHVAALAEAIRAGDELPPPRVEIGTNRIVDGWHRVRAHRIVGGDAAAIKIDARSYKNEADLIKDAIRLNATQGRKLDNQDRVKSIRMLEDRGVDTATIAVTLHITEPRVERLRMRVAIKEDDSGHQETVPVKPILWPKEGQPPRHITAQQYATQRSSNGWRAQQTIGQLIREIRDHVVDLNDPGLCARLWELHDLIELEVPAPQQRPA